MQQLGIPNWLRRALEAALAAGLVAVVSLVGGRLSDGSDLVVLPRGASGVLLLAPSVLALGVIPAAWPTGMAATRTDALFGSLAGFLIAADAAVLLADGHLHVDGTNLDLPAGFLTVILAAVPCLAGITAGQLGSLLAPAPWFAFGETLAPESPLAQAHHGLEPYATRVREVAGAEVGLAVRARERAGDTAVTVATDIEGRLATVTRTAFLAGDQGRRRAALVAAAELWRRLGDTRPERVR